MVLEQLYSKPVVSCLRHALGLLMGEMICQTAHFNTNLRHTLGDRILLIIISLSQTTEMSLGRPMTLRKCLPQNAHRPGIRIYKDIGTEREGDETTGVR